MDFDHNSITVMLNEFEEEEEIKREVIFSLKSKLNIKGDLGPEHVSCCQCLCTLRGPEKAQ